MAKWLRIIFIFPFSLLLFTFPTARAQTELTVSMTVGDTSLLISGKTSPEALVTFKEGEATIGTTTAFADGFFSKRFTAQTPGIHTFGIYAKDKSGLASSTITSSLALTAAAETALSNLMLPPTISLDKNTATQGETVKISGMTVPSSTVAIFIFETRIANVTSSATNGAWSYSLDTSSISLGDQSIYAKTTTAEGYQSQTSQTLTLKVNPATALPPAWVLPPLLPRPVATYDLDGDGRLNFSEMGALIKAWVEDWRQWLARITSPTGGAISCDLNADGICNLIDFSILLYYIGR